MKLELKENMYIRTKGGIIDKILKLNKSYVKGVSQKDELYAYDIDNIVKASYNIIDILEENDYVNGLRVEKNKYGELYTSYVYYGGDIGKQCEVYTTWLKELKEDMIYSAVTHEQMEQMAYKVGE